MADVREARLRLFLWQLSPALRKAVEEALAVPPKSRSRKQRDLAEPFVAWALHAQPLPADMAQDTIDALDGPRPSLELRQAPEPSLPSLHDLLRQTGRA